MHWNAAFVLVCKGVRMKPVHVSAGAVLKRGLTGEKQLDTQVILAVNVLRSTPHFLAIKRASGKYQKKRLEVWVRCECAVNNRSEREVKQ